MTQTDARKLAEHLHSALRILPPDCVVVGCTIAFGAVYIDLDWESFRRMFPELVKRSDGSIVYREEVNGVVYRNASMRGTG